MNISITSRLLAILFLVISCTNKGTKDFEVIDNYLITWDRFAQGANELAPTIKADRLRFETELAAALERKDRRAPSRLVFYAVVQVGGFIAHEPALGRACEQLVGTAVPVLKSPNNQRMYFAGDLFFWWETNRSKFDPYPLLDKWCARDFAKSTVIPMYKSAMKER